jgi:hypothetical protein
MTSTIHSSGIHPSGIRTNRVLDPDLLDMFQPRATAAVASLLAKLRNLHVPPSEDPEEQICLLFSPTAIEAVLSSALRQGRFGNITRLQYQFELPPRATRDRLIAWIEDETNQLQLEAIHIFVILFHSLRSRDYLSESEYAVAALRVVETFSIAICEEFDAMMVN